MARILPSHVRQAVLGLIWTTLSEFPETSDEQWGMAAPHPYSDGFFYSEVTQNLRPGFASLPTSFTCRCHMMIYEPTFPASNYPVTLTLLYSNEVLDGSRSGLLNTRPGSHFYQAIGLLFREIASETKFGKTAAKDFPPGFIRLDELSVSERTSRSLSFNVADLATMRAVTHRMFLAAKAKAEEDRANELLEQMLSPDAPIYDPDKGGRE